MPKEKATTRKSAKSAGKAEGTRKKKGQSPQLIFLPLSR